MASERTQYNAALPQYNAAPPPLSAEGFGACRITVEPAAPARRDEEYDG